MTEPVRRTAIRYGLWQIKTGQPDKKAIYLIAGLGVFLYLIALVI